MMKVSEGDSGRRRGVKMRGARKVSAGDSGRLEE